MAQEINQLPAEVVRLLEDARREQFWKLWGTYLSERQWGTVREDYSANSDPWNHFPHDQARSRAYRWGEDGLLGFCDRFGRLCFSVALWNEKDAILKERLFGLSGPQGNHGEDVKELYYYLDATPTHSYCKALYKYPQRAFPYEALIAENRRRSRQDPEYELLDTGAFHENRYFDVFVEYAKAAIEDILIKVTLINRGPDTAPLHVLPTLWFRNTWAWGDIKEECTQRPEITKNSPSQLIAAHAVMGKYIFNLDLPLRTENEDPNDLEFLFTENETNTQSLFNYPNRTPYVKDAFHHAVIEKRNDCVNPAMRGTKAAARYQLHIPSGGEMCLRFRLTHESIAPTDAFDAEFEDTFASRIREANDFYTIRTDSRVTPEEQNIQRQAYAGLLWSKQFYNLVQKEWLDGDSTQPPPPESHADRNADWVNLFNRDVLSMPDKWEYPYYCVWDLSFHMIAMSHIDPAFAKQQLILLLREWYMHPSGQIPAYEWNFCDVNPPVHAWATWRIYRQPWLLESKDHKFLESVFQKLLLTFTWWVNRKDLTGNNLFSGGFLGLDNIGVFDRSKPLPTGGILKQADGTAWMAFFGLQMFSIALELAQVDDVYEDMASKFFEHFVRIVYAINELGGSGLWDEADGFYYDMLEVNGKHVPLRVRSVVGFIPLIACTIIPEDATQGLKAFHERMLWFIKNHPMLAHHITDLNSDETHSARLLSIATREHLQRVLRYMFDEDEFLSPYGLRSVSKFHEEHPYVYWVNGEAYSVDYEPGESQTSMFGGNSNWRGPIWFPINFLLIEALRTYHQFYGDSFKVEFPTRSNNYVTLGEAARLLAERLTSLFRSDENGRRPCHGSVEAYAKDPYWKNLILFNEYYHAETGQGLGASHQTGWTSLITELINLKFRQDESVYRSS